MKKELDEELCKRYPKIFVNRNKNPTETAMCWGFECGSGWYNLINTLCSNIQSHIDWNHKNRESTIAYNQMITDAKVGDWTSFHKWYENTNVEAREAYRERTLNAELREIPNLIPQVVAEQVKEKFGGLRFYYQGGDDAIRGMAQMAETMSVITCEECGAPGKIRNGGWVHTFCDEHEAEYQQRNQG